MSRLSLARRRWRYVTLRYGFALILDRPLFSPVTAPSCGPCSLPAPVCSPVCLPSLTPCSTHICELFVCVLYALKPGKCWWRHWQILHTTTGSGSSNRQQQQQQHSALFTWAQTQSKPETTEPLKKPFTKSRNLQKSSCRYKRVVTVVVAAVDASQLSHFLLNDFFFYFFCLLSSTSTASWGPD